MIYKILNKEEIGQLKEELSLGLPGTAKIYYVIRNALDDKLSGFEVIVDNWPKWNCILLRPESTDKVLNYFRQTHICHTKSVSALKYFLQRPGLISWNQPINFTGVPSDVIPVLSEVCRKHGGQITSKESRLMYAWSKSSPPDMPKIPEGVTLSSLKPEHAKILKSDWAAKQGNAVELEGYFQSVIEKFESSCLLDSNGRILAYICMQYNGSIAMIYVLPEFRKEGYFDILICDLTRKLLAKQDIAYGFIPFTDTSLINLSRELGFEWVPQGNMTWTRYTPNVHQRRQKAASESDVSGVFSNNLDTLLKSQLGVPLVNI